MFESIYFDITGGCNAQCPLCVTARATFGKRIEYISVPDFSRAVDRLLELGVADSARTAIKLYNWGEPILHPDLNGIVGTLADRGLRVGISTNGSRKTNFTGSTEHFVELVFSVPGWSQASYDKIHGLKFDRIVSNIEATIANVRAHGYKGEITLAFHVYQFNILEELAQARAWCARNGVVLRAYFAYINDYEPIKAYRKGTMSRETLDEISRKLFLHYVDDLVASQPAGWQCPQWSASMTLNHKCEVLLCCVVPEGHEAYAIGSVFDLTREQILTGKTTNKECDDCIGCGAAYWGHNPKVVEETFPKSGPKWAAVARSIARSASAQFSTVRHRVKDGAGAPARPRAPASPVEANATDSAEER